MVPLVEVLVWLRVVTFLAALSTLALLLWDPETGESREEVCFEVVDRPDEPQKAPADVEPPPEPEIEPPPERSGEEHPGGRQEDHLRPNGKP